MTRRRSSGVALALFVSSVPLTLLGTGTAEAAAQTYYVSPKGSDGNAGTSPEKPFRTIQQAADRTEPGDTVSIMNGTYTEGKNRSDVVAVSRSGRPGAPITFRAHPGHRPVIHPVDGWNGIRIDGASYITVKGLEIEGDNGNLTLAGAERSAKPGKPKYNTNCLIASRSTSKGTTPHHIDIIGNTVHHCPGAGIAAINADHLTIDRNRVYATSWYTVYATSGISVLAAVDSDGGGNGEKYKIRVTNNTVHDNETKVKWERCGCYSDGNGIIIDKLKGKKASGEFGPDYRGRVLVANNLAYDNGGSGIHSYKSRHVDIVHNTAYRNGRSTRMESYANIFAHDSEDVRLLNNVAHARPGQATNSTSGNVDVTYDYNVYFGGKAPEAKGAHDIVADPGFRKAGTGKHADFRLRAGSPAVGSGTPFPAVSTDITGARRADDAPDRGAYAHRTQQGRPTAQDGDGGPEAGTGADVGADAGETPAAEGVSGGRTPDRPSAGQAADPKPQGESGLLAATGGSLAPLGAGLAVLVAGAGILFALRRRRTS